MKYIELVKGVFTADHEARAKQAEPYIAYSKEAGKLMLTIVPEENQLEYQMVDLGLPSGLKWADRNVGAETPQENGLYFDWGNTEGHTVDENGNVVDYSFDSTTYASTPGGQYTGETLDAEHDAATVNMDSDWRMPTIEEYQELVNAVKSSDGTKGTLTCQYEYIDLNGEQQSLVVYNDSNNGYFSVLSLYVNGTAIYKTILGIRFTNDTTGASVYFPACGNINGNINSSILIGMGDNGWYWCSSISSTTNARQFILNPNGIYAQYGERRYCGLCVRGVHA